MEKMNFQNGNDLLECCTRKLNECQYGKTGGNVALYPTVIIFMGEKSREYVRYIKSTLDDNWNNARFLQYLNVWKTEDSFKCVSLFETKESGSCMWQDKNGADEFEELLNKSIVKLLETDEKIFADRTRVKIEFVLDATEKHNIPYYELFRRTNSELYAYDLKTLYLMIDQKPEDDKAKKSDRVLQHMINDPKRGRSTIYILSNYLQSGQMLGNHKIWQNYRLVANIILLGGNRKGASVYADNLYNGIKTVSYALVTKPTDEIAAISLQALLAGMYGMEGKAAYHSLSGKDIRERLGMDDYNGMKFAEMIFQEKITARFPKEEDLQYLPFASEQIYKEAMKADRVGIKELDRMTMGAASAYISQHYGEKVQVFFREEEETLRLKIRLFLRRIFCYFEFLKLDQMRQELKDMIIAEYYYAGSGIEGFTSQVHRIAVYESRKLFYGKIKEMVWQELSKLIDASLHFRTLYGQCEEEVRQERIITGDESESVEKVYGNIVKEFIQNRYNGKEGFKEVFIVDANKGELLQAVWNVFLDLIKNEVYSYDFEREVDSRMDQMNDEERHVFVARELKKKLDGSIRLKNPIQISMLKTSCFYMINEKAEYAENLRNAEGNGIDYLLFNLNRTDCIEQLELYNIMTPEMIHLTLTGEGEENEDKIS
ncbi:MAG: hypothetical protein K2O16_19950 [Lachnospiraceae bacterium]|nr:hypothetical protein [Lachnospiraceae bacterium]MDE7334457.1 hypothetical protein [Lachnospiraceae bacterium]